MPTISGDVPGYYGPAAEEAGLADEVDAVRNAASVTAGADEVSDAFLDSVAIWGQPDDVRTDLDELREAGVDLPIVRAPTQADRCDLVEAVLRTFAPAR